MVSFSPFRSPRRTWVIFFAVTFTLGAFGWPDKHRDHKSPNKAELKLIRKDPAFIVGYDAGYRQGGNDSHALANYSDESGPVFGQATDGYTSQYGDKEAYRQRFRQGYIAGYKEGWDAIAGMYVPMGGGSW